MGVISEAAVVTGTYGADLSAGGESKEVVVICARGALRARLLVLRFILARREVRGYSEALS